MAPFLAPAIAAARAFALAAALFVASAPSLGAASWAIAPDGTEFRRIGDRATFVGLVSRYELKRFGITLRVRPDGRIGGRAFGQDVSGEWQWRDGYFCREMRWGSTPIGANCQEVKLGGGNLLRFTSDRGRGDFADLRLR